MLNIQFKDTQFTRLDWKSVKTDVSECYEMFNWKSISQLMVERKRKFLGKFCNKNALYMHSFGSGWICSKWTVLYTRYATMTCFIVSTNFVHVNKGAYWHVYLSVICASYCYYNKNKIYIMLPIYIPIPLSHHACSLYHKDLYILTDEAN
jgi:hypothetical protein